ncbi:carbohydrate ABC transporter permease [Halobacillus naozhouensis]|uniref:Carbohydrate ABC transporter permease n=1 Tax=Halobacillus naozhouensis TaxID=554880 RepID=A0ABY8IXG1_9BACI|nr:carbohydrate ABC transporter permease [Halobacillus naozhouensis]WFT74461.1 carbohydrate ABC transporter permease [Halobacillus naozhouensis]
MANRSSSTSSKKKLVFVLILCFYLVVVVFPFLWILITSFKSIGEIFGNHPFRIIPENPTIEHYANVILERGILNAVWNSLVVSGVTTIYIVFVATMASYAISRFEFFGKNLLLGVVLAVSMFPQMIVIGPIYNLFVDLGWTNSYGITLPYSSITLPLAVWILVTHFNQIPIALEESAKMDGANRFQTLFRIVFPLAAPGVFTTAIIVFITAWNEFVLAITINSDAAYHTVPVAISFLRTQFEILWGQVAAATIIVTIPTLLIVLFFQKRIVSGLTSGGVKE